MADPLAKTGKYAPVLEAFRKVLEERRQVEPAVVWTDAISVPAGGSRTETLEPPAGKVWYLRFIRVENGTNCKVTEFKCQCSDEGSLVDMKRTTGEGGSATWHFSDHVSDGKVMRVVKMTVKWENSAAEAQDCYIRARGYTTIKQW